MAFNLCGARNDQVVLHAARALRKLAVRREDQTTVAVGVRAAAQLESLGRATGIATAVEEVLRKVEEWHFPARYRNGGVVLCAAGFGSMIACAACGCCLSIRSGSTD